MIPYFLDFPKVCILMYIHSTSFQWDMEGNELEKGYKEKPSVKE